MPEPHRARRAPSLDELPDDYHVRIEMIEERHWWHQGMRASAEALLGDRLHRPGQRVLDAGCGTGGFLRWLLDRGAFTSAAGLDAVPEAIALARRRVPEADLRVALLPVMPFEEGSFDLVVCNDVLQHLELGAARETLVALRRVLRADGALLLRTSGARRSTGTRAGWGAYTRRTLDSELAASGLRCRRITHANLVPSLLATARRRAPADLVARQGHGIPQPAPAWRQRLGAHSLALEAYLLGHTSISLPYGHTLLTIAEPAVRTPRG